MLDSGLKKEMNVDLKQKAITALKEMREEYGLTVVQIVEEGISEQAVRKLLAGLTLDA